ncbi:hypothetical protein BGZ63DRAFT_452764 [Mariannaea sp. PMI_226]|nr:hypothetical protein BGZ63DRAFT_452764 [Mariannaea sp. PMI_226]
MSDVDNGKLSAWTDDAKYQFLLRVVAQFKEEGKQINWQKFEMPGRTTKSLQNMWTKVNKQIAELEANPSGNGWCAGVNATAKKAAVSTPRKRRGKKAPVNEEDSDGEAHTPIKTPGKHKSPGAIPKRTPKVRKASKDDDVTTPVKGEFKDEDDGNDDSDEKDI